MGKKKIGEQLPAPPSYQEDSRYTRGLSDLFGLGRRLTSFDFTGDLAPLMDTISTSPEMTKLFLTGLKSQMDPIARDLRTQTTNTLAATNQLESSVTANRLAQLEGDIMKNYITQSTQFGIADINRALSNRIGLFGTGLNTLQAATGSAQQEGQNKNVFALTDYENRIAKFLYDENRPSYFSKGASLIDPGGSYLGFYGKSAQSLSPIGPAANLVGGLLSAYMGGGLNTNLDYGNRRGSYRPGSTAGVSSLFGRGGMGGGNSGSNKWSNIGAIQNYL